MSRFSNLPDEIICHILSFLATKEAALTSVLSKRWRNLFALVRNLDVDDSVFLQPEEARRDKEEIRQIFMDFVDRILALQGDSPIKKVSISCVTLVDSDRVDNWLSNVLARGVSDLDLCIILDDENYAYPPFPKFLESSNLVKLKVGCDTDKCISVWSIFLPMLKTLVLDKAWVMKFDTILHALPVLEELVLADVILEGDNVSVSSASLKTLTFKDSDYLSSISFDTPSLVYFEYGGFPAFDYPAVNMKNLIDARIIFSLTEDQLKQVREPDGDFVDFSNVWKLFHGVRNVPYLELSSGTLEVLSLCIDKIPLFNNLKVLRIKSDKDRGWQAMPVLLRNCPHLETLILKGLLHHVTDKCGDACDCVSLEAKGRSLTSSPVKKLEIQGFRGTMEEMNLIKHFLKYFPSLKEMKIYVTEDSRTLHGKPQVSEFIMEAMELYNKLSNCNVQLLS